MKISTTHKEAVFEIDCKVNSNGTKEPKHTKEIDDLIAESGAWHELQPNGKFITVVAVKNSKIKNIKNAKEIRDKYVEA